MIELMSSSFNVSRSRYLVGILYLLLGINKEHQITYLFLYIKRNQMVFGPAVTRNAYLKLPNSIL